MKLKKQLKKLRGMLDARSREQVKHREDLRHLLHKMKSKEKELSAKAADEPDDGRRARLEAKVEMLHAQRRKGIRALRKIDSDGS